MYDVGIVILEGFSDVIKELEQFDDRLMKPIIISADPPIHFCQLLDAKIYNVSADDYIIIAGDLHCYLGEKAGGNKRHGGKRFGPRHEDAGRIVDFVDTHEFHLIHQTIVSLSTIYSGNSKSQIDYILIKHRHFIIVADWKSRLLRDHRTSTSAVGRCLAKQATDKTA